MKRERVHLNELEENIEKLIAVNQTQQHEIERLGKLAWETQKKSQESTMKPFPLLVDTKDARFKTYYQPMPLIPT